MRSPQQKRPARWGIRKTRHAAFCSDKNATVRRRTSGSPIVPGLRLLSINHISLCLGGDGYRRPAPALPVLRLAHAVQAHGLRRSGKCRFRRLRLQMVWRRPQRFAAGGGFGTRLACPRAGLVLSSTSTMSLGQYGKWRLRHRRSAAEISKDRDNAFADAGRAALGIAGWDNRTRQCR